MTLLADVNDGLDAAERLADLLLPHFSRHELLVNLIPYNQNELPDTRGGGLLFRPPSDARVGAFRDALRARGAVCTVRTARGDDERSACGQLATDLAARRRRRPPPASGAAPEYERGGEQGRLPLAVVVPGDEPLLGAAVGRLGGG